MVVQNQKPKLMSLFLSNLSLEEDGSPTFFELSMSASLNKSFKPAFDYLVNVLFERNPSSAMFSHLMLKRNEAYFVLLFLVERHYLKEFNSSFCENFYGLKRVLVNSSGTALLPNSRKLTSLLELVLLPYACVRVPKLMQAYELVSVAFQFAYMFKKSRYFSPAHYFQGITLLRLDADDMKKLAETNTASTKFSLVQKFANALRMAIVASAVVFKIAEYYYSNENRAMREANQVQMRVPPPPMRPNVRRVDLRLCPLCGDARVDPALSTSGFCFCYACLLKHVQVTPSCPITNQPCQVSEIRKVFVV